MTAALESVASLHLVSWHDHAGMIRIAELPAGAFALTLGDRCFLCADALVTGRRRGHVLAIGSAEVICTTTTHETPESIALLLQDRETFVLQSRAGESRSP